MFQSDCLSHIVSFLEPHELQALRCTGKAVKQSITDDMKRISMENTVMKYRHKVVRMRDGAVRFFTRLGRQTLDMYAIDGEFEKIDNVNTPLYMLRQYGMGNQIGSMTSVELFCTPKHSDAPSFKRAIFEQGNDAAILTEVEAQIGVIYRQCQGTLEFTTFVLDIDIYKDGKTQLLAIKYDFSADFPDKTPIQSTSTELRPL